MKSRKAKKLKSINRNRGGHMFMHLCFYALMLFLLASCQKKEEPKKPEIPLREGEVRDVRWPKPVICAVADTICTNALECPSKNADCVTKSFRVPKDTLYVLTTSYFNGDTLNPSCRACGTVYQDTVVIKNRVTSCPTGGAWVGMMQLKAGVDYLLSVSLQRCEKLDSCKCGDGAIAEAAVSLLRQF